MDKKIWVVFTIVAIGVFVSFFVFNNSNGEKNDSDAKSSCSGVSGTKTTVKVTSNGFSPSEITIKRCDTVEWVGEDSDEHWPASDLHPTHEIYSQFDPREPVPAGESWSFTFDKLGNWKYHDHLFPLSRGTVTVSD